MESKAVFFSWLIFGTKIYVVGWKLVGDAPGPKNPLGVAKTYVFFDIWDIDAARFFLKYLVGVKRYYSLKTNISEK